MKIAKNVEMLEIKGEHGTIYPVLVWDDTEVVLIDAAVPGQNELLREAVTSAGFSLERITKVIITHQDLDHIGCAKVLSELGAEILAHELEAPYIQGDKTSIRLVEMERRLGEASEAEQAFYEQAKAGAPLFYVHINKQLKDGDTLDICGGIKVLHTPGHLPGHIALLLEESNIIAAGDGANIADGKLTGSNPQFTVDMEQADASLQKMLGCNPTAVVCYHGGLFTQ
jgi:glyoxylase-like metal-dependent hydrolase (beta-lactamase superfamily II)